MVGPLEETIRKPMVRANLASLWSALDDQGQGDRFHYGQSGLFHARVVSKRSRNLLEYGPTGLLGRSWTDEEPKLNSDC